ncbi:MAG TPA: hypothetical protein VIM25_04350 [Candidatus Limnocylindrales bacterium]|jgi:hypothetical protein
MTWDGFWFGASVAAGFVVFAIAIRALVWLAGFVWGVFLIARAASAQKRKLDTFERARRKARDE